MNSKLTGLFRKQNVSSQRVSGLHAVLNKWDITALGIAAIIGAGIFATIGKAASDGGPAVVFLFLFTAVACLLSALCYAEFASAIPNSGSAYTYAYASMGELIAWIIGWDLVMEYAIGNVAVAISWSEYFTTFLAGFHIHIPAWLTMDYYSAYQAYQTGTKDPFLQEAWSAAPAFGKVKLIVDLPALLITALITYITYIGIKESKRTSNGLVIFKLLVLLVIIAIGFAYVQPENWIPFAPNKLEGILKGVSAVFFAYIGFDAISTTAEECKDPQRDLPLGMFYALGICTVLYVLVSLVLTGLTPYYNLDVSDPVAFAFKYAGLNFISGVIAFSAIIAMTGVLLVFQLGQPRIWYSMSRDGLLPPIFSRIHPKFKTPSFSTLLTGAVVALPAMFLNLTEVTDLCSIGTLFAFVVVCAGVLYKPHYPQEPKYKVYFLNSRWWLPPLSISYLIWEFSSPVVLAHVQSFTFTHHDQWLHFLFIIICIVITFAAVIKQWSLIPTLGLLVNLYLMSQLGWTNWARFFIWLLIGLVVYFSYGHRHSLLRKKE
ncbi:MAG: amino acid transporter [Chitinophagaceae bacterium]|nr:amino acid transporter [Chitinophagaceae bacterium]